MKMNFFMRGFQRRVWCPKWTPASSRSFIVVSATNPPVGVSNPPHLRFRSRSGPVVAVATRPGHPGASEGACVVLLLPLAELEALARARLPVLLALLHP